MGVPILLATIVAVLGGLSFFRHQLAKPACRLIKREGPHWILEIKNRSSRAFEFGAASQADVAVNGKVREKVTIGGRKLAPTEKLELDLSTLNAAWLREAVKDKTATEVSIDLTYGFADNHRLTAQFNYRFDVDLRRFEQTT